MRGIPRPDGGVDISLTDDKDSLYNGFNKPIGVVLAGTPYALVAHPDRPGFRAYVVKPKQRVDPGD